MSSRNPSRLEEASRLLEQSGAPRVVPVIADLRLEEDVRRLARRVLEESGGHVRVAVLSYGNTLCEPSPLGEEPWVCWAEAARLYLASTATMISVLARESRGRVTVAAVTSFTVSEPHPPLIVADAVRAGLPAILSGAARRWPGKVQTVLLVLGSFRTPGAEETVRLVAGGEGLESFWRRNVEALSPLGRAGRLGELEDVAGLLLELPEYIAYTPLRIDGGSGRCLC